MILSVSLILVGLIDIDCDVVNFRSLLYFSECNYNLVYSKNINSKNIFIFYINSSENIAVICSSQLYPMKNT